MMIKNQTLEKPELLVFALGGLLLVFGFYFNLGIYPLTLEEPRRGMIALEMLFNDNFWVPTQTGGLYFRKPPVYNWLLIFSYQLFGEANELSIRFFSVFSHLLSGALVFWVVKRYLNLRLALYCSLGFLLSADILTYFSALGEIDLFYALITSLSIFLIYILGQQGRFCLLFLSVYTLTAIGFLTKGLTSLPFTAISLLVYFILTKNFKKLLGPAHILGIVLFAALVGGYFYVYAQYEDVAGWWSTLLSESTDKATAGGFMAFVEQLISFPLETLKILLPATFFVPLLFLKGARERLRSQHFIWFCVLIFVFNYPIYWFSTEAKSRYLYPLFPFAVIALTFLFFEMKQERFYRILKIIAYGCLVVFVLAMSAVPFLNELVPVEGAAYYVVFLVILLCSIGVMLYKGKINAYLVILLLMVVLKLAMSSFVPVIRRDTSNAAVDKRLGISYAEISKDVTVSRYKDLRLSLGMMFYMEREKGAIIPAAFNITEGYYFLDRNELEEINSPYELIDSFDYKGTEVWFIKVNK